MAVHSVNDQSFEQEVMRSELPVLLDLYADWCGPCKQLAPLVEQLSVELEGKLKVVKIDVEASPMIAQTFRAQSIPMLIVFNQGQPVAQHAGMLDLAGLQALVKPFIGQSNDAVTPEQMAQLLAQQRVLPVDIRETGAYARYRIPGAVNIPSDKLADEKAKLAPSDGRIRILYGRTTDGARDAAKTLQEQGVQVAYLEGGFLHWESDNLEVERG